ncbi:hypothetical protein LJC61_03925 [Ruminococcaceae bacterium OttesenSCG-928-A16]|nr:hypothetical protein [Ruminococcaceae bacterium OttesenSCG-928-A16]
MTQKELGQLYWLNREIEMDKRQLEELTAAAIGAGSKITGLPHAAKLADKTALTTEIANCKALMEAKIQLCLAEYTRLHRFISTVEDSQMRMILTLRHINGLNWRQISFHVGGGNTEDGVKMAYHRFLKKSASKPKE